MLLFFINHPAQFHLFKHTIRYFLTEGMSCKIIIVSKDILEELVGEIQDEYDTEQPIVEKIGENKFRALAQNPVDEINHFLPEPLPESVEYVTLAGLLLQIAQDVPTVGQIFTIGNYQVKITLLQHTSPEEVELEWQGQKS